MVGTNQSETSITDLLAKLIVSSPTHQKDDPLGWAIIAKAYTDNTPAVATIMGKTTGQIHDWVTQAITEGIQSGELRPELDPDAAAWLIEHTLIGLGHYLMSRFGSCASTRVSSCTASKRLLRRQSFRQTRDD